MVSVIKSGILDRDPKASQNAVRVTKNLLDLSEKKSYLKEACTDAILMLISSLARKAYAKDSIDVLLKVVASPKQTPETLTIVLGLQKNFPVTFFCFSCFSLALILKLFSLSCRKSHGKKRFLGREETSSIVKIYPI